MEPSLRTVIFVAAMQSSGRTCDYASRTGRVNRSVLRSVLWHRRIHFIGPGENTTFQARYLSEARASEEFHGLRRTLSALAMRDDLARAVEFMHALRQLAQRDQMSVDVADLIFVRLAHVKHVNVVTLVEPRFQLGGGDFRYVRHSSGGLLAPDAAEFGVINQLGDRRMSPANGAIRIFPQLQFAEFHGQRVEQEQAADERLALADNQLKRLGSLNRSHDSRQDAQHSAFGARWDQARRRRFRVEAAVAGPARMAKHGDLPFEAENRAIHIRLASDHTGVVYQIARGKIVRAIHDDVVVFEQLERVGTGQLRFVGINADVRIQIAQAIRSRRGFGLAHVAGAKENLALKIRC